MWSSHNNIQYLKAKVSPSQPGVGRADYMAWAAIADDSSILTGTASTGRSCSLDHLTHCSMSLKDSFN
ncbi:hypothetical protein DPMN_120248 [Dreissena polymorpha]|uniref:Uncharacterized protein n=1 Tax=Dreissena polymorpha TaxID=45954 RepID=A0A9D4JSJ0_DREPO|nr:hypothetical protein DPMN_120248 [Dreissena polymorpha]